MREFHLKESIHFKGRSSGFELNGIDAIKGALV